MRLAIICLAVGFGIGCKAQPITCGIGTHAENGTCVADRVEAQPPIASVTNDPIPEIRKGTISIAIVMNGWELWVGNDQEVPELKLDDPSRFPGALIALRAALDTNKIGSWGPAGSQGMVITFGDKPVVRVPMGPLDNVSGSSLGTQKDYFGTTGVELVSALRLAVAELEKTSTTRRALIVICDGNDTNNEAARSQLEALKKQAAQDGILTFGIIFKATLSGEENVLRMMIPDYKQIVDAKELDAAVAAIAAKL